jgi:hypothetical protein
MTGTDALEMVLLTTGAVTTAGAVASMVQSLLDRQALTHSGKNGIRQLVVSSRIIRDAARVIASLVLSGAAFWCLWLPPDMDAVALILKHALMFIGWFMLLAVFTDWQTRRHLEDMLDRLDRGGPV